LSVSFKELFALLFNILNMKKLIIDYTELIADKSTINLIKSVLDSIKIKSTIIDSDENISECTMQILKDKLSNNSAYKLGLFIEFNWDMPISTFVNDYEFNKFKLKPNVGKKTIDEILNVLWSLNYFWK
jgi:hypothetical protein